MPRYFLELAYKGTNYSGFQVQENAPTIQEEIEKALQTVFRRTFELTGSSRTDAGVHAKQNFFHFDTDINIEERSLYNINAVLPDDIVVKGIFQVPDQSHCRFDAVAREYRYFIYTKKDPFMIDRGWLYPYPLNISALNKAADAIKNYTDFTSFSKRNTQVKTHLCAIERSTWEAAETGFVYHVRANRFLRGMVRGLVGTMLRVGRKQLSINEFKQIIESKDCTKADFSTPAKGLFLEKVEYNDVLKPFLSFTGK